MRKAIALLLCAVLLLAGCSNSKSTNTKTTTTTTAKSSSELKVGRVQYETCGTFKCASIKVPLDYSKPKDKKIDIAFKTLSAAKPKLRKGILLINPGGPGGSGIDLVNVATSIFSSSIIDSFDIVGWDPRGVGQSTKPSCSTKLDYLFDGADYSPDSDAELQNIIDVNTRFGVECTQDDKNLAAHIDSISSAKDMDQIRKALGENRINYLGYSYGTALGQIYASLFPNNYRAIVIDGVLDVGLDPLEATGNQGISFEKAFDNFFEYCRVKTCKYSNGIDPKLAYENLAKQIDAAPIPSPAGQASVGPAQFDLGTGTYMYGGLDSWPSLDEALKALQSGNTEGILLGYNSYVGRDNSGVYDGSYASFLSILCADGKLTDGDDLFSFSKGIAKKAPLFGQSVVLLGIQCSYWPDAPKAKPFKVNNSKGKPVMVIGTTGDPATPIEAARDVAKKLDNSTFVEYQGEGHTAYGRSNACVQTAVDDYLLKGLAPKQTTFC